MLQLSPDKIPAHYQRALRLQNAGKFEKALEVYSSILRTNPQIAEVHFQIGRIFQKAKQNEKAVFHLTHASEIKPKEVAIWSALADSLLLLDDQKKNSDFLKKVMSVGLANKDSKMLVKKLNSAVSGTRTAIGSARKSDIDKLISLIRNDRFAETEALGLRLQARHPEVAIIANILASAQVSLQKPQDATRNFEKAIALDPKYAEAHSNFGRLLSELGEHDKAVSELEKALKLAPNMPLALTNMGAALARTGKVSEAETYLKKAIRRDSKLPAAHFFMGNLHVASRRHEEAVKCYKKAIKFGHKTPESYVFLGRAMAATGLEDDAMVNFDHAISLDPKFALAYAQKASLQQSQGNFSQSDENSRKAIGLDPDQSEYYRTLITVNELKPDDPLVQKMIKSFDAPETSDANRRTYAFGLSKVMEDAKQYDKVFKYLNVANQLVSQEHPYDINTRKVEIQNVKKAFENVDLNDFADVGYVDYAPIFVTGMPRSGTTLIEQIIASHSSITGAGEVGYIAREAYKYIIDKAKQPLDISKLPTNYFRKFGKNYADFMRKRLPDAHCVSDKSIQTYTFLGLVKLALPNSRIIIVRRDPRDNLLSIYKNMFVEGTHQYAYNLRDLGLYYKLFEEIIDFWRESTPESFYEIQYEDLIANPEEESRKLIAACGLEWEDQCLNFHQNKRRVETLSLYQVRQPIYKSSVKGWQRYENELGELFEALK